MKLSKTSFIWGLLIIFVLFLFVKSIASVVKTFAEIKNPPPLENVKVCPLKTPKYFSKMPNGEYLYALYRYESLGVKCEK